MWETRLSICRLGLFQDSGFAGDFEDSKWTSERVLCIFGSRTFVPTSWMWRTNFSLTQFHWIWSYSFGCRFAHGWQNHSSFLKFWDGSITLFFESTWSTEEVVSRWAVWKKSSNAKTKKHSNPEHPRLTDVDHVTRNAKLSYFCALLYVVEEKVEVQQCDTVGKNSWKKGNPLEKKRTCWTRRKLVGEELETKNKLLEEKLLGGKTCWKNLLKSSFVKTLKLTKNILENILERTLLKNWLKTCCQNSVLKTFWKAMSKNWKTEKTSLKKHAFSKKKKNLLKKKKQLFKVEPTVEPTCCPTFDKLLTFFELFNFLEHQHFENFATLFFLIVQLPYLLTFFLNFFFGKTFCWSFHFRTLIFFACFFVPLLHLTLLSVLRHLFFFGFECVLFFFVLYLQSTLSLFKMLFIFQSSVFSCQITSACVYSHVGSGARWRESRVSDGCRWAWPSSTRTAGGKVGSTVGITADASLGQRESSREGSRAAGTSERVRWTTTTSCWSSTSRTSTLTLVSSQNFLSWRLVRSLIRNSRIVLKCARRVSRRVLRRESLRASLRVQVCLRESLRGSLRGSFRVWLRVCIQVCLYAERECCVRPLGN